MKIHPTAQPLLAILAPSSAEELAELLPQLGLRKNFSALKALATVGIQNDFMALHAQTIAVSVGAIGAEVTAFTEALVSSDNINAEHAKHVLAEMRKP